MNKNMLDTLLMFVNTAAENKAEIWLLTSSGLLTGTPLTYSDYMTGLKQKELHPKHDIAAELIPESERTGVLLNDAKLLTGNTISQLGLAILDAEQISGYGFWVKRVARTG